MARTKLPDDFEVPTLPPFPSEHWHVKVLFDDGSHEIISVQAKGKASAIRTATYGMDKWSKERITSIQNMGAEKAV